MTKSEPSEAPAPNNVDRVADAPSGNWVDRYAPALWRPYLRLSRADRPIGTWLLLLPCWWGVLLASLYDGRFDAHDLWILMATTLGAFLMRGAGCTWNDFTDREFDGQVARTRSRPIPSGQVTPAGALMWMVAQALVAFCILLTFNPLAIWLGVAALIPVAIYPFAKRFTWWPQVFLGIAFNWGALWAWAAHRGTLEWPAVLLYLSGIAWTLFYDTIYAHQDKEDDALIGIRSTARLFAARTPMFLLGFAILSAVLFTAAVIVASLGPGKFSLGLALLAPAGFFLHMFWQMRRLDLLDMGRLLLLFRSNRDAGLWPVLIFACAVVL